jgi:hypothetical protein
MAVPLRPSGAAYMRPPSGSVAKETNPWRGVNESNLFSVPCQAFILQDVSRQL